MALSLIKLKNKSIIVESIVSEVNSKENELEDITRTPPYGKVESLDRGERYCINRIVIKPGEHMSTQMHYHRSEHWIVVSGTAKVICDGKETLVMQNQSTYVPMNTAHRVENPGVIPLVMIEVRNGEYLGDDEIIRFDN